ncbi:glycosyl transferase group 1 [Candidatus Vecturithrix granuli]|uniref:Glycosyl transferase group 1 n=1 Tax=Vecturithrix granuli TaxID=1499967 RepID=A0A081BXU7_VECG1|nr:glycosyl transferase group 1 [Candidatus Vecturithrix granuli]
MGDPSKIRVLHVVGDLSTGGIQQFVMNMLQFSNRAMFEMDVCEMSDVHGGLTEQATRLGSEVFLWPLRHAIISSSLQIVSRLRSRQYHVVQAYRDFCNGIILRMARHVGIPVRIAFYGSINLRQCESPARRFVRRLSQRLVLSDATHILGVSNVVLHDHFQTRATLDSRMQCMYSSIDLNLFQPTYDPRAIREELGIPPDALVVGNVARFAKEKNHQAFIQIAHKIADILPNVRFLLVGDGPLKNRVFHEIDARGLSAKFILPGRYESIPRILASMDVFLFPSLWEGFPFAIIEAQAAGLPCVVSELPVFREEALAPELRDNCFPLENLSQGVERVLDLLKNSEKRRKQGEAARRFAALFDVRNSVKQLEQLYLSSLVPNPQ